MLSKWWREFKERRAAAKILADERQEAAAFEEEKRDYIDRKVAETRVRHFLATVWWPANRLRKDAKPDIQGTIDIEAKRLKEKRNG